MRILYHHRTQGRRVEGVHIRGIVNALRELGHQVRVLSFPGADPEQEPKETSARQNRSRLGGLLSRAPGVLFELLEMGYNLITLFRVGRALRGRRPDFVYERYALFLCVTIWLARRRGIPIILEINDSALVPRVRPLTLTRIAQRLEGWCWRNANGLVFISSWFRDKARDAYGEIAPSVISPNAADIDRFDISQFDRSSLRRAHGIDDAVVCGYIGGFVPWHGIAGFVQRIAARLAEASHLKLLLVGDGPDLAGVQQAIAAAHLEGRVLLPGHVAHAEIPSLVACMDYAVLADSNQYGSPMKLFELMAMGVAVVAPDYGPIAEVIESGQNGWLFSRKDIDACVDTVLQLAADPEELLRVGAAAQVSIADHHQWRNNAEQLLSLVQDLEADSNP